MKTKKAIKNPKLDKRFKLTPEQKQEIFENKNHLTEKELASKYKVSLRTIQFTLYPEKLAQNKLRRQENSNWRKYYDKDKHREKVNKHNAYLRELKEKGLI